MHRMRSRDCAGSFLIFAVALISRPFGGTRVPTLLATVNAGRVATFTFRSPWLLGEGVVLLLPTVSRDMHSAGHTMRATCAYGPNSPSRAYGQLSEARALPRQRRLVVDTVQAAPAPAALWARRAGRAAVRPSLSCSCRNSDEPVAAFAVEPALEPQAGARANRRSSRRRSRNLSRARN